MRPPPRSTLFPYTTLFRSHDSGVLARQLGQYEWRYPMPAIRIDRKSTRLNSSHVAISYAVFCLKKKKRIHLDEFNIDNVNLRKRTRVATYIETTVALSGSV